MEGSKRVTKVFGQLRFDYHAQRNMLRRSDSERAMEDYDNAEPSVRHARTKSPSKSKPRGRS